MFRLIMPDWRVLIRRTTSETLTEEVVPPYVTQSKGILVWGAISYEGVGPLVLVEETLDSEVYINILREKLKNYFSGLWSDHMVFQHNGAPAHRHSNTQQCLKKKKVNVINWPPQSPDLNIIEDCWNKIKYELRGIAFEVENQWYQISKEFIQSLYSSLPRRIEAVGDAQGGFTKY